MLTRPSLVMWCRVVPYGADMSFPRYAYYHQAIYGCMFGPGRRLIRVTVRVRLHVQSWPPAVSNTPLGKSRTITVRCHRLHISPSNLLLKSQVTLLRFDVNNSPNSYPNSRCNPNPNPNNPSHDKLSKIGQHTLHHSASSSGTKHQLPHTQHMMAEAA